MKNLGLLTGVLSLALLAGYEALGRNYYISGAGSDRQSGRSAAAPWKTPAPLQRVKLQPGDTVFLERGHLYRGSLLVRQSGTRNAPIVITAYGRGAVPVLAGSAAVSQWQRRQGQVWEADVQEPVYDLFYQGRRLTPARYPNSGYLAIDKGFGKDSIACAALQQPAGYWKNALLHIRTIDWVYETRNIRHSEPGLLVQGPQTRYVIDRGFMARTDSGRTGMYQFQKGYGFFLEGLPALVDTAWEWSWQNGKLRVQLPEGWAGQDFQVEAVTRPYGIWLEHGVSNIQVQELAFAYQDKAGVGGGWHLKNIEFFNNSFSGIHGAGILLDSASEHCVIRGNTLTDILGRGISALEPAHLQVEGNQLQRIGLSRGHGWTGVNGASGIVIYNNERRKSADTTYAHHNIVRLNRVDSCGYIGIRVDGHHNLVEQNVIDHCSLTLNDGANLYCFATEPGITHHSVFRNNIVRYSVGDSYMTPDNPNLAFGIYLDNNSHDMLVEGNTVIGANAGGFVNNDASFRNTFRHNTTFDCKEGIGFAEWANLGRVFDCVVEGNVFVAAKPAQKGPSLTNFIGPVFEVGVFRNNTYVNTGATQYFYHQTKQVPQPAKLDLTFPQWQRVIQDDTGSRAITAQTPWVNGYQPFILVNDRKEPQTIKTGSGQWLNLEGNAMPAALQLAPFSSLILFKKTGD